MEPWREEVRDDYLMHYGVKGMKWKKRKAGTGSGNAPEYITPTGKSDNHPKAGYIAGTKKTWYRRRGEGGARINQTDAMEISTDMSYESNPRDKWYRWAKRRRNQLLQTAARQRRKDWGQNLKYKNPSKKGKMYAKRALY